MLFNGEGAPANQAAALTWLRRSAGQGFPQALFVMGDLLYRGDGMAADPAAAWAYLRLAEQAGFAEAAGNRQVVEGQLDPAARQRAIQVLKTVVAAFHREEKDE